MDRICYRNGIAKPENEALELHAFCNCDKCKLRKQYMNGTRNTLTVIIYNVTQLKKNNKFNEILNEVKQFIENWECKKSNYDFRAEYIRFECT